MAETETACERHRLVAAEIYTHAASVLDSLYDMDARAAAYDVARFASVGACRWLVVDDALRIAGAIVAAAGSNRHAGPNRLYDVAYMVGLELQHRRERR